MLQEGHLLLILHEAPAPDAVERTPAFFWRSPGGEWMAHRKVMPSGTLGDFLNVFETRLLLDSQETAAATAAAYHTILEATAPVLRTIRSLHRALQEARDMVKEDRELINHRDRAASLERTAELLLQDAQFGLSYIVARKAETQAASAASQAAAAHRLNILAALFLPLTAVPSLLGMEIHSGLADTQRHFWLIVGASIAAGLLCAIIIRRKY